MELTHPIRSVVVGMPFLFRGKPRERAGTERLAAMKLDAYRTPRIEVESTAFEDRDRIPARYSSADGENLQPPLRWSEVPRRTSALVLLVEDPDAPTPQPFVHWIAVIAPNVRELDTTGAILKEGRNTFMKVGWLGCAPPKGDVVHHYHFQLFALDVMPEVGKSPGRSEIIEAMKGHVLGFGELVGTYQR